MHFAFTDDQRLFGQAIADLLQKQCPPEYVRSAEATDAVGSRALWSALAATGLLGLTAPEECGGLGMNDIDLMLPLEESGRAALPDSLVEPVAVGIPLLRDYASAELQERWIPRIVTGDALLAVGFFDHVLDADTADLLLMRADNDLHVVARDEATVRRAVSIDGTRQLFDVQWNASPSTRIGGADAIATGMVRGALGTAAQLLGVGARLIEMAAEYAQQREQFGKAIGSFQAVKHLLANALLRVEFARPVVYNAAHSVARALPDRARDVSMAKAFASEAATNAARAALQVHGAIGYTQESDLHLWMKRAWSLGSAWGNAAFHREQVAAALLDQGRPS